jgi:hypothetical protein
MQQKYGSMSPSRKALHNSYDSQNSKLTLKDENGILRHPIPFGGSALKSPRLDESVQQDGQSYIHEDDMLNFDKSLILP